MPCPKAGRRKCTPLILTSPPGGPKRDQKNSPSRLRFRPPLALTFRLSLATLPYCLRVRLRPTRAPCSAQAGHYEAARACARGPVHEKSAICGNSIINISTAIRASCGESCGSCRLDITPLLVQTDQCETQV